MTVDYFIEKFENIPEDKWCVNYFIDPIDPIDPTVHCALGHCGESLQTMPPKQGSTADNEYDYLKQLFRSYGKTVRDVNDGTFGCEGYGKTPKQRILKVLHSMKELHGSVA